MSLAQWQQTENEHLPYGVPMNYTLAWQAPMVIIPKIELILYVYPNVPLAMGQIFHIRCTSCWVSASYLITFTYKTWNNQ